MVWTSAASIPREPNSFELSTRERVLDTAEKLFAERGFAGTAVRDIAKRWGFDIHGLGRLVTHEMITPHSRSDAGGGWDAGLLRKNPRISWNWITREP